MGEHGARRAASRAGARSGSGLVPVGIIRSVLTDVQLDAVVAGIARGESARSLSRALGLSSHTLITKRLRRDPDLAARVREAQRREQRRLADAERKARAKLRVMPRTSSDGTSVRQDATMAPERAGVAQPVGCDDPAMSPAAPSHYRKKRRGSRILSMRPMEMPRSRDEEAWLLTRGKVASADHKMAAEMSADGYVYAVAPDGSDRGWYPRNRVPEGHMVVPA